MESRAVSIWPREFSWLTTQMAHHATVYTAQLEMLLAEPQMVALLTASPQAGAAAAADVSDVGGDSGFAAAGCAGGGKVAGGAAEAGS